MGFKHSLLFQASGTVNTPRLDEARHMVEGVFFPHSAIFP